MCDACSRFVRPDEIQRSYQWCHTWFSNQHPSFVSFLLHENQIRLCVHCDSWKDRPRDIQSRWLAITSGWIPLKDIASLGKVDSVYRLLTRIYIEGIREKQKRAIRHHTPLTPYERSECLLPIRHTTILQRWNFIQTNRIQFSKQQGLLDRMELMWKLKRADLDSTRRRSVWGCLWQNQPAHKVKLLYHLAKIFQLQSYIPSSLASKYDISSTAAAAWAQWFHAQESTRMPTVPCPIWKEVLDPNTVTQSVFPSATRPTLIRWGRDKRGLLWKRESGSVDRMMECSIAICSEALREHGILQFPQVWYEVNTLQDNTVVIQIVPNCVALSELVESKQSLLEFICDHNDGVSVAQIRRRLMESIAFSGAISWFFGFGDRHLDNLMITTQGSLFHIDFGFCFGREPKVGVPRIRITESMMQSLGEDYWKQCLQKGQTIMNWLKANLPTIRTITEFATGDSKDHILSHWRRIEADTTTFEELAMESIGSWTASLHDFFHSQAQSLRSIHSLWSTITNVFVDSSH